jgi:hypothetical protein
MTSRFLFLFALLLTSASPRVQAENEIGFIEKFALAPDREKVLGELIPGSEEYYFFHALHYQNTAQTEKLKAIMQQWAKRFPDSEQRKIIENRAAILGYDADPQATLKFLRERLHLQFNHVQEARDKKPDLPSVLDPKLVAREVFEREALTHDDLGTATDAALEQLVRDGKAAQLKPSQRRALLKRLMRPDLPGLVTLIAQDLKTDESGGFGEFQIHSALLPEQLDELVRLVPDVKENANFVHARLRKLAPSADADAEFDPKEREPWLDRLWNYTNTLSPAFNSLKAAVLFQRLHFDRTRGVYDKARFTEYLNLPRQLDYVSPRWLEKLPANQQVVDLNANLSEVFPAWPPIASDEWLVRDYLLHILKDEPQWQPWAQRLRDTWLKPIFAEAKIVNGIGDPEQWASLLTPSDFQKLKERVDIEFAPDNAQFTLPNEDVKLGLFIKNVPKLIVKIYEINTLGFFLANARQLNTDLNLDGLVPNAERTVDLSESPFLRVARSLDFPECKGRGAWVIEFIGGGKSSRALVRKGQWNLVQNTGAAGDTITVLDETQSQVKDAVAWLDGRKFTADEKTGRITIPFTNQPGQKNIVLADAAGSFASLASFEHHAENYRLDAQFHIEREQLLVRHEATLAVRAALLLNDVQLPLDLLKESKLTITTTTLDGVSTTTEVDAPKFTAEKVFTHKFTVPDRLASVAVKLTGKVESLSKGGEKQELNATCSGALNGIDKTEATSDAHLSKFGDEFVFEQLGKNGEPLADQQVVLAFYHRDFQREIYVALRTDEKGRINLGRLADIVSVKARLTNGREGIWPLRVTARLRDRTIDVLAGEAIRVPWDSGENVPISLLESRGLGFFVRDISTAVAKTPGFLEIKGLAPGDYSLQIRGDDPVSISIRVTAGKSAQSWLVSANRDLERRNAAPVQVESVSAEPDAVVVKIANANAFTRVHIAATRFLPRNNGCWNEDLFDGLAQFARFDPGTATPGRFPNLFSTEREIGDEYRYIIERRYAQKFPGNMLSRPGLLLNPWEKRSTDQNAMQMASGQAAGSTAGGFPSTAVLRQEQAPKRETEASSNVAGSNLDFLANGAPVFYNLVPDKDGVVRIERKALGDRQHVQIYAEDLTSAVWRSVSLAEADTKFADLRLLRNLDPQTPFSEKREVSALSASGQSLTLADIVTSELETYDTLSGVHALFTALNPDANLAKFAWVLQWPKLSDAEKRAKYSEFACHELNFFLSRKDPAFFEKVIQPYLRNKKDKTFMDDFLVGNDLAHYREPWAYARLNVVERCLLAQRIGGDERAATARHLRELWELLPPDPARQDFLFEAALRGRALQQPSGDIAGFYNVKIKALAERERGMKLPSSRGGAAPSTPALTPSPMAANEPMGVFKPDETRGGVSSLKKDREELRRADDLGKEQSWQAQEQLARKVEIESKFTSVKQNDVDGLLFDAAEAARARETVRAYYRKLGPTKEWAENNYYQLPIEKQDASLVTINAFWRDYAAWDGKAPFLSINFAEASRNFTEMMLALAVLDLPFESDAPKHTSKTENGAFTLTAAGPVIAFHKQIKPAPAPNENNQNSELLVSENFYRHGDRYRMEGNEKFDKYVTDEFLVGAVYGANVVVTNPTSSPQKLDLLLQIPQGALPVLGSKATDSRRLQLAPYTTQTFEYAFYFPAATREGAKFAHYPVHVSRGERIVGAGKPFDFNVVPKLTQFDKGSWDYVSQYGSDEEVFAFLEQNNIERLKLERVAWRVRQSVDFFRKLIALMQQRHVYDDTIYSYAVVHNDTPALREWLKHRNDFVAQLGPWLDAKLVRIDPIERRAYEHLEYAPLVNQRAHRVGSENRIANTVFRQHYQALLNILAHKSSLDAMDEMSVVYYLFLQDRVEEALTRFHTIKPESLPTQLQHDYFRCYADLYEQQLADARAIAAKYAEYPVDRWRKLFVEVGAQLDEIEGKTAARTGDDQRNREAQQAELAKSEPTFDFKVENRTIALTWKNLGEVTVNYYLLDPEFAFSANPFISKETSRFSIVKPSKIDLTKLPAGKNTLDMPLPKEFANANVLVELIGAGQRKTQLYHANTLKLTLAENYGRLDVRDSTNDKPVSKAYVKVYARLQDGTVRFFKDGYTDLRGKFDYASLNSSEPSPIVPLSRNGDSAENDQTLNYQMLRPDELDSVEKLSMLVLSESNGALVREVEPPKQ